MAQSSLQLRELQHLLLKKMHAAPTRITDGSLAAFIADQYGEEVERSTLSKMRSGERRAPLGLFLAYLHHCDQAEKKAVLSALVRWFGFELVDPEAAPPTAHLQQDLNGLMGALGDLAKGVSEAVDPDSELGRELSPREANDMLPTAVAILGRAQQLLRRLERRAGERAA